MTLIERDPARAARNAIARIRMITASTTKLAETAHAELLLDAVREQVEDELVILERIFDRTVS